MNVCFISSEFNKNGRGRGKKKTVHLWCTSTFFRGNADQQMSAVLQHECVERGEKMLIITFGTLTNHGASNRRDRERGRMEGREEKRERRIKSGCKEN